MTSSRGRPEMSCLVTSSTRCWTSWMGPCWASTTPITGALPSSKRTGRSTKPSKKGTRTDPNCGCANISRPTSNSPSAAIRSCSNRSSRGIACHKFLPEPGDDPGAELLELSHGLRVRQPRPVRLVDKVRHPDGFAQLGHLRGAVVRGPQEEVLFDVRGRALPARRRERGVGPLQSPLLVGAVAQLAALDGLGQSLLAARRDKQLAADRERAVAAETPAG